MQIIRVDEQGFALSDEDIDKLAGSNLEEMMKIDSVAWLQQEIMKEIDITNYYYIEELTRRVTIIYKYRTKCCRIYSDLVSIFR